MLYDILARFLDELPETFFEFLCVLSVMLLPFILVHLIETGL